MTKKKQDAETPEHSWAETRPWHRLDQELRAAGCRLMRRPPNAEPIWRHRDHGEKPQGEMAKLLGLGGK